MITKNAYNTNSPAYRAGRLLAVLEHVGVCGTRTQWRLHRCMPWQSRVLKAAAEPAVRRLSGPDRDRIDALVAELDGHGQGRATQSEQFHFVMGYYKEKREPW